MYIYIIHNVICYRDLVILWFVAVLLSCAFAPLSGSVKEESWSKGSWRTLLDSRPMGDGFNTFLYILHLHQTRRCFIQHFALTRLPMGFLLRWQLRPWGEHSLSYAQLDLLSIPFFLFPTFPEAFNLYLKWCWGWDETHNYSSCCTINLE